MIGLLYQRDEAIVLARLLVGDPGKIGTIRGDLAESFHQNLIHATDCPERVLYEASCIFGEDYVKIRL